MKNVMLFFYGALILAHSPVLGQDPSTWSIIRDKVLQPGCASCHVAGSSFARQSGLILTPDVAYSQLIEQPPTNQAALNDGLLRVGTKGLESFYNSFLWEKIDAPSQEHFYSDHPYYGALMPLGGKPLTNGELELIKRWILAGAPENVAIAGADETLLDDTTRFEAPPFAPLPAPAQGLQFHIPPFTVAPNYEREILYYQPNYSTEDLFVNRVEINMRPGSHHLIMYLLHPNTPNDLIPQPQTIRDYRDLNGNYIFKNLLINQYHLFFAGTQWPLMNYHFPEGVALRFPAGMGVDLNSHYANRTGDAITGEIFTNLHTVPHEQVKRVAEIMFLNYTDISLPPKQVTTLQRDFVHTGSENLNIFQLFSHAHEHMTEFRVELRGGPRDGELIYIAKDWEHPPILELDPPLTLKPGEGLRLKTTYDNWTDRTLGFGLLSEDEMMILFGYYFLGNMTTSVDGSKIEIPTAFALQQNYPNPFNPGTTIPYHLSEKSDLRIEIFDATGRSVVVLFDGVQHAGSHRITWNAGAASAGIYFVKMRAGAFQASQKLLLVK